MEETCNSLRALEAGISGLLSNLWVAMKARYTFYRVDTLKSQKDKFSSKSLYMMTTYGAAKARGHYFHNFSIRKKKSVLC